jgi:hypothetical protein
MTLINGASSNSNFERDIFPQIQALLQTNNDVVMAIHKSFVESTSQINQRMVLFANFNQESVYPKI